MQNIHVIFLEHGDEWVVKNTVKNSTIVASKIWVDILNQKLKKRRLNSLVLNSSDYKRKIENFDLRVPERIGMGSWRHEYLGKLQYGKENR